MTEYGLDLDAAQVVHWLMDDRATRRRRKLDIRAMREYAAEPVTDLDEAGIGDDQEVAALSTIGTLEVQPVGVEHAWVLRVRIEDVLGSHLPDDQSVPEDTETIDLDAFYEDFVVPDRGTVYVSVEAGTAQAKRAFDRVLSEMVNNRHGGKA